MHLCQVACALLTHLGPERVPGVKFAQQCTPIRWEVFPLFVFRTHKRGFSAAQCSINRIYRMFMYRKKKFPKLAAALVENTRLKALPLVLQPGHIYGPWNCTSFCSVTYACLNDVVAGARLASSRKSMTDTVGVTAAVVSSDVAAVRMMLSHLVMSDAFFHMLRM